MLRHRFFTAALVASMLAIAAPRSLARQQITDISGPFGMPVGTASLNRYAAMLDLDAEQTQLMKSLYQGYRGAFKQAVEASNKELSDLEKNRKQEGGPGNQMNQGMEALQRFAAQTGKTEHDFFEDLKAILKPEQVPKFARVEHARRREIQMRFAFVAGEGTDLVAVLEQLKIAPTGELAATMDDYENAIDHLMIEKARVMQASLGKASKIQKNGLPDFALVGSTITDLYDIGGRIRDSNRQFARRMEPLLPEAQQAAFNLEIKKRSFPKVYAQTLVQKGLAAAKDLEDLTPDQRSEIAVIAAGYTKDLDVANQHYAAAIESTQDRFPKEFLAILQSRFNPDKDDSLSKAQEERKDLDQKAFSRLRTLLKPEQFKQLPQFDPEQDNFPEFLPNLKTGKDWEKWQSEEP